MSEPTKPLTNFQSIQILKDEIEKKSIIKRAKNPNQSR
jgi:hypothetical protein